MKALITVFKSIGGFLACKFNRRIIFIAVLSTAALVNFLQLGLARRTFVFYNLSNETITVEDRMVRHTGSREADIIRYTEEALLGPVDPELRLLFPQGTRLNSLLFRNDIVFADLSAEAVMPPKEGGETLENFRTLHAGILRNFSYIKDVRFFIEGKAVFPEEFPK